MFSVLKSAALLMSDTAGKTAIKLLSGYAVKLCSKEFMEWALFRLIDAIVKRTDTKEDDAWAARIKKLLTLK